MKSLNYTVFKDITLYYFLQKTSLNYTHPWKQNYASKCNFMLLRGFFFFFFNIFLKICFLEHSLCEPISLMGKLFEQKVRVPLSYLPCPYYNFPVYKTKTKIYFCATSVAVTFNPAPKLIQLPQKAFLLQLLLCYGQCFEMINYDGRISARETQLSAQ